MPIKPADPKFRARVLGATVPFDFNSHYAAILRSTYTDVITSGLVELPLDRFMEVPRELATNPAGTGGAKEPSCKIDKVDAAFDLRSV